MANIAKLLTEHIDIWSTAESEKKSGRGRSSGNTGTVYGVKKLRELILELAVRGKLVPQDPNDEPASELLKRIQAEKAKLIAEGKFKKEKPLQPIAENEKTFELPKGWEWSRLGELFTFEYGDNLPEPKRTNTGEYPVYGSNGIVGTHSQCFVKSKCIVIGRKGSAGALNLSLYDGCCVTDVAYYSIPPQELDLVFSFKLLHTLGLDELGKGIKPGLNRNEAYQIIIAIPPVVEQHRIVAKVDELMALCDQLEQQHSNAQEAHEKLVSQLLATLTQSKNAAEFNANWQRIYAHFDVIFTTEASIDALKQTLLQLAVMGKLVPQDPDDEPASELLKRIQAEKAKLIAEGKLKKEKSLAPIAEDEKPFELPQVWEWVRLGNITNFGVTEKLNNITKDTWVLDLEDIEKDTSVIIKKNRFSEKQSLSDKNNFKKGDVLYGKLRPYLNKVVIADEDGVCTTEILPIRCYGPFVNKYFMYALKAPHFLEYVNARSYGMKMPRLGTDDGRNSLFPLAPLTEQHRIVAKVDALMALCDQLKTRIQQASQQQQAIADALVAQAVA